jgi:hypothetical protein
MPIRKMSAKEYSEDALVEQPAIQLFAGMGWQTINAYYEAYGASGTLGRENAGEVVLMRHLFPALKKLNPGVSAEVIREAAGLASIKWTGKSVQLMVSLYGVQSQPDNRN